MGIFGWGKDEAKAASDQAAARVGQDEPAQASAMERAQGPQADGLDGAAQKLLGRLLDVGIDGAGPFDSAQEVADSALAQAGGDPVRAMKAIERDHKQLAAVGGFATGLGGFFTMPVSLPANLLEFYILSTRMTAAFAKVHGHDVKSPTVRTAVLLTLIGADADEILKKAGVQAVAGGRLAALALERLPKPALMVLNKAIAFRMLGRVGQGIFSKLGRAVPVVGGAVGAGLDMFMIGRIADAARREFATPPAVTGTGAGV